MCVCVFCFLYRWLIVYYRATLYPARDIRRIVRAQRYSDVSRRFSYKTLMEPAAREMPLQGGPAVITRNRVNAARTKMPAYNIAYILYI